MEPIYFTYFTYFWLGLVGLVFVYNIYAYLRWRGQRVAAIAEEAQPEPPGAIVFSPIGAEPKDGSHGDFGRLVECVDSKKFFPLLKALGGFFLLWAVKENQGDFSDLSREQSVVLSVFFGAIAYYTGKFIYNIGSGIKFYQYGFVVEKIFGSKEYSYGEIRHIDFTHEIRRARNAGVWFSWRVPVVVVHFTGGRQSSFYSTVYNGVVKKFTRLQQNLVKNRDVRGK